MSASFVQDPQAVLDYVFDWFNPAPGETVGWLAVGETITAFAVTPPTGILVGNGTTNPGPAPSQTGGKVTAWLSGGTAGIAYDVVCHITTSAGRQDDRSIRIHIADQ